MSKTTPPAHQLRVALLIVLLTGCQTWRATFVSPGQLIPVERPSTVRVTLRSGARLTLENPTVRNDTIFGVTDAGVVGVALEDFGLLEVRQLSILRSIGLGYLTFAVVLIVGCSVAEDCDSPY